MKPFRKNVAIAIDGGGIKGIIVTKALSMIEEYLSLPVKNIFHLTAGTSTGSLIAAGIAAGLTAQEMYDLYTTLGNEIFKPSWRTKVWPLVRYKYPAEPLEDALRAYVGELRMGEFWEKEPATDVVITTFDLVENRTRFIKPWKKSYRDWPVVKAVMASCTVPTYFPVVERRYVDGGVGSYSNPCYLAAYEIQYCLGWDPAETTLISLGTGRSPHSFDPIDANKMYPWEWIGPALGAFQQSADDQQVHLVKNFFQKLDFRRFQVDFQQPIQMDDVSKIPRLAVYGEEMGRKILHDMTDQALEITAVTPG